MNNFINILSERWQAQMPKFFKCMIGFGASVAAIAVAVQMALTSAGANIPAWWETIYPYLIGIGAGVTTTAKFTQDNNQDTDKSQG